MHASLAPGIVFEVGAVVVKEVALNLDLTGLIEKSKFICPQIGVIAFHVRIASDMARPRRLQRQEVGTQRASVDSTISPIGPTRLPVPPQAFVVRHSILDYEPHHSFGLSRGLSKTH